MKRLKIELLSFGLAAAVTALFAGSTSERESSNSGYLTACQARAQAASYLEASPRTARLDATTQRWSVSDGRSTAWLDARSGELLEVEFGANR